MTSTLDAALRYAAMGWRVIPGWWPLGADRCACGQPDCGNVGKHPLGLLVPHGRADAAADPAVIRRWWRAYPAANVALATGPESGVWVLDLDGDEGRVNLKTLVCQHGSLPRTPWAITGSGGWHLYFRWPADRAPRSRQVPGWPGVDVRGKGSSATLPPSLHRSGRRYAWKPGHAPWERPLADAPAWLLDLVDPPRPKPAPVPAVVAFGDRQERYARAALANACRDIQTAAAGTRNAALNAAAYSIGQLVAAGYLDRGEAADQLEAVGISVGQSEREARSTVASGFRAGALRPRHLEAG